MSLPGSGAGGLRDCPGDQGVAVDIEHCHPTIVHRATMMRCRCRCAHIFNDPYNDSGGRRPCSPGR